MHKEIKRGLMNNIYKILSSIKTDKVQIIHIVALLSIFSSLYLRFNHLNRTLIPSDEGWYLTLLRDTPNFGVSRFHLLFKGIFNDNLYIIRLTNYILTLLSNLIFSYGLYAYINKYLAKKNISYFIFLGLVFLGQQSLASVASPSINYASLNLIIGQLSIGFLLISIVKENKLFLFLSGFTIAFLCPIMITTSILIIPSLIFSLYHKNNVTFFLIGILSFFILYFSFIEPANQFFAFLESETQNTIKRNKGDYGLLFILKWGLGAIKYYIKLFMWALLLVCLIHISRRTFTHRNLRRKYSVLIFIFSLLLIYCLFKDKNILDYWNKYYIDIYWIIIFTLCINNKIWKQQQLYIFIFFLSLFPICLSIGSNVPFNIRQICYITILFPIIYILLNNKKYSLVYILFLLNITSFWYEAYNGRNWFKDKYSEQTIPVSSIGIEQNLYLDKLYIEKLKFAKSILNKNEFVICDYTSWGFVFLLDLTPICYNFRLQEEDLTKEINTYLTINNQIWLLLNYYDAKTYNKIVESIQQYTLKIYKHPTSNFTIIKIIK